MKTKIVLFLAGAVAITGIAQTNVPPVTNSPSLFGGIGEILKSVGLVADPTNYAGVVFVGKSTEGDKLAAGLLVIENMNNNIGIAAGVDHLWFGGKTGSANIVAGGLTLKEQTHPLRFLTSSTNSWLYTFTATPYAIGLVGTPINGTGNADGGLASVTRAGANIDIYNLKGWQLGVAADYGARSGSGNYNGNYVDLAFTVRKGF